MFDLENEKQIYKENRIHLFEKIKQIPECIPKGWEKKTLSVGGLMYVGFSEVHTEQLICISSQGQSLINCMTGEKIYEYENYDEIDLIAYSEILKETVSIAGEGGGGLRHFSIDGNTLEKISPLWPREQIIFMPEYSSCWITPEKCSIVFDDFEIKAYGFNKTGNIFIVAVSSDLTIYKKI